MKQECLRCHSDPKDAPAELIKRYGPTASFHRKLGDVVGLDRVAVPVEAINASLASEMRSRSLVLAMVFALLFGSIFYIFRFVVTQRLVAMANHFDEIAAHAESTSMTPVEVKGNDEISVVGIAFNKLVEQLRATHASLEQRVSERTEALRQANAELQLELTERKRIEEELRKERGLAQQYLDITAVMMLALDAEGQITLINKKGCQILGYRKEELVGRDWFETCLPLDSREKARGIFNQIIAGDLESVRYVETQVTTKNGEPRLIGFHNTWIRDEFSRITGTLSSGEDITTRKQAEVERLHFSKLESLGTLAGGIAHDFNNILTAILGNIGLAMLEGQIGPQVRQRLARAEQACLRAQALSQQLLTFAKGGAPVKKLFSVAELLTESTAFTCVGSPVRCETTFPENLWSIEADPGQIGQVFQNLTINAIQAMPTGGTIKVWAENLTLGTESGLPLSAGRYIKISMRDQGTGIPEKHLPRIFDPYFTTKHKGSGLGLASAYAIVNKHQGHIAVESKPGVGTTFYIYLPAVERQVTPQPEENRELLVGKGKILVMDDEDIVREVLGRMLARLGYEAEFARDGGEAIEMFVQAQGSGQAFAEVILDLTVPGAMGGKETMARLLRSIPR